MPDNEATPMVLTGNIKTLFQIANGFGLDGHAIVAAAFSDEMPGAESNEPFDVSKEFTCIFWVVPKKPVDLHDGMW